MAGFYSAVDTSDGNGFTTTETWIVAEAVAGSLDEWRVDGLNVAWASGGTYTITARATDGVGHVQTIDHQFTFHAGYAVLVQGKVAGGAGLRSHNKTANRIYQTLLDRGFADGDIFYFNHNPNQDFDGDGNPDADLNQDGQADVTVDGLPIKADVAQAILGLKNAANAVPAPIHVIFVGHGADTPAFPLNDTERITPSELRGWLETLEGTLDAATLERPRVVIVGANYSGGFIPQLSGPNRLIITSAAADQESYKGGLEADGIRGAEYFLEELFQQLGRDETFKDAFTVGAAKTYTYTRIGGTTNPAAAAQHPLLDDDGDGGGSNRNSPIASVTDGALAANWHLGGVPIGDLATVSAVTETLFLPAGTDTALLWLDVDNSNLVGDVFIEVREPGKVLTSQLGTQQLDTDFVKDVPSPSNSCYEVVYGAPKETSARPASTRSTTTWSKARPLMRSTVGPRKSRPRGARSCTRISRATSRPTPSTFCCRPTARRTSRRLGFSTGTTPRIRTDTTSPTR